MIESLRHKGYVRAMIDGERPAGPEGATQRASPSALTARSECGATPVTVSGGRARTAASDASTSCTKASGCVPKRICPVRARRGRGRQTGVDGQEGEADPVRAAAARSALPSRRGRHRGGRPGGGGDSGIRRWWHSPPPASPSAPGRRWPRILGGQRLEKAVHDLPPGPERVARMRPLASESPTSPAGRHASGRWQARAGGGRPASPRPRARPPP